MRTVIVPVDFSSASVNAANYALDFARAINASLTLLYVCQVPVAVSEAPVAAVTIQGILDDAEKTIIELKDDLLRKANGTLNIYTEVKEGYVVNQVAQYCKKVNPYAVIMGAGDASATERVLFGSNTLSALKNINWPLIIVPKAATFRQISSMGLACDLRNVANSLHADEIRKMVIDFKAKLHILHVNTSKDKMIGNEEIEGSEWIRDMFAGLKPEFHFLYNENIEAAINDFSEKNKLDMLIVIPKKHGMLEGIFHKSEAKKVALHTHLPLLSVHE
ncbi:MAG: universal stress protein [Bacteroidetes bacterium]|nr:universal stress protein [Bacteroidota bacterium]MBS1610153.1 universal stress protein [Bacteroidota bacterium]